MSGGRFPELLRAFREEVGWTQADGARFVGVAPRTWQSWEASDVESGRAVPEPVLRLLALYRRFRRSGEDLTWEEMNALRASLAGGLLLKPRLGPYKAEGPGPVYSERARAALGPPEEWTVLRDEALPLSFCGWRLGEGAVTGGGYHTVAEVYLTEGGAWVPSVHQEHAAGSRRRVAILGSPAECLAWLRDEGKGQLKPAAAVAWRYASLALSLGDQFERGPGEEA